MFKTIQMVSNTRAMACQHSRCMYKAYASLLYAIDIRRIDLLRSNCVAQPGVRLGRPPRPSLVHGNMLKHFC